MRTLLLLLFSLAACHAAHDDARHRLAGSIVVGAESDVSGLLVTLVGPAIRTTETAGDGAFSFGDLPAGHYTLSVLGDSTREEHVDRDVALVESTTLESIALTPLGSATGTTLGGALVTTDAGPDGTIAETIAETSGDFVLSRLPVGAQQLYVLREGYVPAVVPVTIMWRQRATVPTITLSLDTFDPTQLELTVTRADTGTGTGVTAALEPGGLVANVADDGALALGPLASGLYRLRLVHPHGELELRRIYFGNGRAYLLDQGLSPLTTISLSWGYPYPANSVTFSPRGTFFTSGTRVFATNDPLLARIDLAAQGLLDVSPPIGFLADDSWLVFSSASMTTPGRRSFYRVSTTTWIPELLADADERLARIWPERRAVLLADRIDPSSFDLSGKLVGIDDKTVLPLGAIKNSNFYDDRVSPSRQYRALRTSAGDAIVRVDDGITVGVAGPALAWSAWHPYLDLLLFRTDHFGAISTAGEVDYGGKLPFGVGWSTKPNTNNPGGLDVGPPNGLIDATRTQAIGTTASALVAWDLETGDGTLLTAGVSPTPITFYDGERRVAFEDGSWGNKQLALYDRQAGARRDLGALAGQTRDRFAIGKTRLAFVDSAGTLYSYAFDGSDPRMLAPNVGTVAAHPESDTVCFYRWTKEVAIVSMHGGDIVSLSHDASPCKWLTANTVTYGRLGPYLVEANQYIAKVTP